MAGSEPRLAHTNLEGVYVITASSFTDERGYFMETYVRSKYSAFGIRDEFVQDDVSWSRKNVLRGLHGDWRMNKIVQVAYGSAYDVIVDARSKSITFGKWQGFDLDQHNHEQIYVPAGCLHGFLVMSDFALMSYKHSVEYDPSSEFSVHWDDPDLGIAWPMDGTPDVSERDRHNPLFRALSAPEK